MPLFMLYTMIMMYIKNIKKYNLKNYLQIIFNINYYKYI